MPLTDDQVETTLDWLGRTQPLGQKQLALATATGGAPTGGPVTPGGPSGPTGLRLGPLGLRLPSEQGQRISGSPGLQRLMQALGIAEKGLKGADLTRKLLGGPPTQRWDSLSPETKTALEQWAAGEKFPFGAAGVPAGFTAAQAAELTAILGPASAAEVSGGVLTAADAAQLRALLSEGIPALSSTAGLGGGAGAAGAGAGGGQAAGAGGEGFSLQAGPALTAAGATAGAIMSHQDWQKAVHAFDAALALTGVGAPVAAVIELALGIANLFGAGGGQHTKGSTLHLPGFSPEGVRTRTAGGTATVVKSYREGAGAANALAGRLDGVRSLDELAALLNENPQPGRLNVGTWGGPGAAFSNRTQERGERRFTAQSLEDPAIVNRLTVQAGAMGAPADRPDLANAIRWTIMRLIGERPAPAPTPPPPRVVPPPAAPPPQRPEAPRGPAGALGFSRDILEAS